MRDVLKWKGIGFTTTNNLLLVSYAIKQQITSVFMWAVESKKHVYSVHLQLRGHRAPSIWIPRQGWTAWFPLIRGHLAKPRKQIRYHPISWPTVTWLLFHQFPRFTWKLLIIELKCKVTCAHNIILLDTYLTMKLTALQDNVLT